MLRNLSRAELIRLALTAAIALVVLLEGLLAPVLLGLLVYAWSCVLADALSRHVRSGWVAALSGTLVSLMVLAAFVLLVIWSAQLATAGEIQTFLLKIEDSLLLLRAALPEPMAEVMPASLEELRVRVGVWARQYAVMIGAFGGTVAHFVIHLVFAILVAAMASAATWQPQRLAAGFGYLDRLISVLERVVLAQLRIAMFNTAMTALYLFVILPAFGVVLPFRGLMTLFTLVTGVLPVLGNLLANTVVTLISLAVSPWVAVASLAFLVLIHKTEYFINARTVGARVQVASWEILAAMLIGEALFGVQGLVAAPLLYPFFKRELLTGGRPLDPQRVLPPDVQGPRAAP